jgi:DNA modification methylase
MDTTSQKESCPTSPSRACRKVTDLPLRNLLKQYEETGQPLSISFRKLVKWLSNSDRATHLIHPYPAKLLMHIPHFFLANNILSNPGDTVLDPFSGTGTVLLESVLTGRNAIGADSNPLARLISKVKISPICQNNLATSIHLLIKRIPSEPHTKPPDVINLEKWFCAPVIKQLVCILEAINKTREPDIKDFFLVCFSKCVRSVSLADPRLSVPVKLRVDKYPEGHWFREKAVDYYLNRLYYPNLTNEFLKILNENADRVASLEGLLTNEVSAKIICSDARNLIYEFSDNGDTQKRLPDESVQIIITSPPYAGAQKYIRSSSLSLGWLGMCSVHELRQYERATIGREHYHKAEYTRPTITGISDADKFLKEIYSINPLRAHIAGNYLNEMRDAFIESLRILKPNGYMILVAANNRVCGKEFKTQEYLKLILEELGLSLLLELIDDIRSRGLMTKRNKTASMINREWILLFQKRD